MDCWDFGEQADITILVQDKSGNLVDPTDLTLRIRVYPLPYENYSFLNGDITRVSLGTFTFSYMAPQAGDGDLTFNSTGAIGTSGIMRFTVQPTSYS